DRPGDHGLPTPLPDLSELEHRVVPRLLPGLFGELAASDGEQLLSGIGLPLQNRPRSLVLLREERAAGMTQKDLEAPLPFAAQHGDGPANGRGPAERTAAHRRRCELASDATEVARVQEIPNASLPDLEDPTSRQQSGTDRAEVHVAGVERRPIRWGEEPELLQ